VTHQKLKVSQEAEFVVIFVSVEEWTHERGSRNKGTTLKT